MSNWFTGPPQMIDDIEFYFWKPNTETDEWKSICSCLATQSILVVKMSKVFSGISGGDVACTNFGKCQLLDSQNGLADSLLRGLWNGPIRIPT